jgi:O-antigen/teichoic acid export membrane protein
VLLYLALIPPFGAYGAAVATLLGFTVRFGLTYRFAQRLTPIAYHWSPVIRLMVLATTVVLAGIALRPEGLAAQFALALGLGLVYLALAWMAVLSTADRVLLRTYASRALQRIRPAAAEGL